MRIATGDNRTTTTAWVQRFWERIKEDTGLSIIDVLRVVPFSDIDQWIQGFDDDPERAADEQVTKWKEKYPLVDQALRDKIADSQGAMHARH